jgi:hypothetical protein
VRSHREQVKKELLLISCKYTFYLAITLGSKTMQTIQTTAQVDEKGILQIQLPEHSGENLDILLVYQIIQKTQKRQWSQRFLSTFGAWLGEPLEREPQP